MTRTAAAHANGALSHGPTTEEGKTRSSQNARKHGLSAAQVVVPGESQADFNDLCESIHTDYRPATAREEDLVAEISANRWRLRRLVMMETAVVQTELDRAANAKDQTLTDPDLALANAWAAVAVCPGMKQIHRHEVRLRRSCEKAAKELDDIQAERMRFELFVEQQEGMRRLEAERLEQHEARNRECELQKTARKPAVRTVSGAASSQPWSAVQNEPVPDQSEAAVQVVAAAQ